MIYVFYAFQFKKKLGRLANWKRRLNLPLAGKRGSNRLPTFLIIGAAKAGTTSLYHYLNAHPAVYMSPVKEPHYFSYQGNVPATEDSAEATRLLPPETSQLQTLEDYATLFRRARAKHTALGEASTGYLCGSSTPAIVGEQLPDVKLIAILRNPAERAWSEFRMMRRFGEEPESSLLTIIRQRPATRYLELGRYCEALQRWYTAFPQEQIQVHLFEDFVSKTGKVVEDALRFIGVNPDYQLDLGTQHNTGEKNDPELDAETRQALVDYFREDILCLEKLIERDLSHWLVASHSPR